MRAWLLNVEQVRRDSATHFRSDASVQFLTRTLSLLLCLALLLGASPVPVRAAFFSDVAFDQRTTLAPTKTSSPGKCVNATDLESLVSETLAGAATTAQNGSVTYTHDAVGNRLTRSSTLTGLASQSFGYDLNDRVTGDTYDANGNTITGPVTQLSTFNSQPLPGTDTYDTQNRLVQRSGTLNSQPSTINILYDGDGHKVRESVTRDGLTTVTTYLVDELNPTGYAQVIEEKTNGTLTRVYTYGHDLVSQDAFYGGDWHLATYAYDGHGSVRFLTNELGQVTDTYDYDAFGSLLATAGPTPNSYLYCGEALDSALGLYYLRARLLNPLTGRFWTQDSFEGNGYDPISLHKYLYADCDPVNGLDPSGQRTLAEVMTTAASIATVATRVAVSGIKHLNTVRKFIWNNQTFRAVSRAYWSRLGPANGRSLHHWLFPQRWTWIPQGLRNAGFNLLQLPRVVNFPGGLNSWMGFAVRWGGYRMVVAIVVENGIRVAIPLSLYGAWELGDEAGQQVLNFVDGYEETELTPDELDELKQYVEPDAL